MEQADSQLSTGLPGLDRILKGLMPGDNIVWQVDSIENYLPFLPFYCKSAGDLGQHLIYFRFAKWAHVVRVIDAADLLSGKKIYVNANPLKQRVVSYLHDSNRPHTS